MASFPIQPFKPRLISALAGYDRERFLKDLIAGATVGIVALPLAMAFAIASGLPPQAGIWTAIIAGFLISALGGSSVQIGGPAGAFIVIVFGIVERYGLANLLISTVCAGVLLFAAGLTGLGRLVRHVPLSIVVGFTNGIAVLILLSQMRDWLGLAVPKMPADAFSQIHVMAQHLGSFNPWAFGLGVACVLGLAVWPRLSHDRSRLGRLLRRVAGQPSETRTGRMVHALARLPSPMVALVTLTALAYLLKLPVETIGARFGGIAQGLPAFALPDFSWEGVKQLVTPTLTIALLGAVESLLCARVADQVISSETGSPDTARSVQPLPSKLAGAREASGETALEPVDAMPDTSCDESAALGKPGALGDLGELGELDPLSHVRPADDADQPSGPPPMATMPVPDPVVQDDDGSPDPRRARHDPNQELMAQGIANVVAPFFGGMPATGTIARTVTNIRSGGTTPVAGMIHALTLLIVVLAAAPLAQHVPLAVLAGILLHVGWNMGEWREFAPARLRRFSRHYRLLMLGTFFLTVVFDLMVAVQVGMVVACALFIRRMSQLFSVELVALAPPTMTWRLYGALFFGAAAKLDEAISAVERAPRGMTVILDASHLISIDASGIDALRQLLRVVRSRGGVLCIESLQPQPLEQIERSGFAAEMRTPQA